MVAAMLPVMVCRRDQCDPGQHPALILIPPWAAGHAALAAARGELAPGRAMTVESKSDAVCRPVQRVTRRSNDQRPDRTRAGRPSIWSSWSG